MRKIILSSVFLLLFISIQAQNITINKLRSETARTIKKDADTTKWTWKRGGLLSCNISQGSLSNWAAGGDNFSLSVGSYVNYYMYYKKDKQSWDNNVDFNLGYIQSSSLGGRKNDDRIDMLSKFGYKIDSAHWYLSGLFNFRTQMFDGYTYAGAVPDFSSSFLSPAYITLSAGFDYKPTDKFSAFASPLTARWVIIANNKIAAKGLYGVDSGKHVVSELGAYITLNYNNTFNKSITYKARLDLFSNYLHNPQDIDFYMTNLVSFKINKFFSATYSLDMIYDDNVRLFGPNQHSPGLQLKSLVGIGFLMPIKPVKRV